MVHYTFMYSNGKFHDIGHPQHADIYISQATKPLQMRQLSVLVKDFAMSSNT